jgi:hypothetical protein
LSRCGLTPDLCLGDLDFLLGDLDLRFDLGLLRSGDLEFSLCLSVCLGKREAAFFSEGSEFFNFCTLRENQHFKLNFTSI